MSDLIPFNFNGSAIRVINEGGKALFVASDVASHLGYSETSAATRSLDEDEKGLRTLQTLGGAQEFTVITEAGLYRLVMRSTRPEAKPFQKWAAGVIEEIRKTGSYGVTIDLDSVGGLRVLSLQLAGKLEDERAKVLMLAADNQAKTAALAVAEPKARAFDRFLDTDGLCGIRKAARDLGQCPNLFAQALRDAKVLGSGYRGNFAYSRFVDAGHFQHRRVVFFNRKTQRDETTDQAFFTAEGLAWVDDQIATGKLVVRISKARERAAKRRAA